MKPRTGGTYRYWHDGQLQPIAEPWRWVPADEGLRLEGLRMQGERILLQVAADYTEAGCVALLLDWQPGSPQHRRVAYRHLGAVLEWQEDGHDVQRLELAAGELLFPLLRAATGFQLRQLVDTPRGVLVPDLHDPSSPDFLHPLRSQRHVLATDDGPEPQRHFRYFGGEYGDQGCDCWLDRFDLMLRYQWQSPEGLWEARLDEARPAETQ